MKAEINKDGQLCIDAQSLVGSFDDKTLRCIAQYAAFDEVLLNGVVGALVEGEMWGDDDEPPWWFSAGTFNKLRMRLLPLLPEVITEAVRVIERDRKNAEARATWYQNASRHLESHWPDRARLEEICKPLRARYLDYPITTKEQAAAHLRSVEARIATEQPEHDLARAETAAGDDMRSDYLAAHLWLTQHCIPTRKDDGTQMTLTERVRFSIEDRTNAQSIALDNLRAQAQALGKQLAEKCERIDRMRPLHSVLGDYDWTGAKADGVLPEGAEQKVIDAFAYVEAEERKAKEGTPR